MPHASKQLITVRELMSHLEGLPPEAEIFFGCESLEFHRVKMRGENYYQIEFNQTVYDDEEGNVIVQN